MSGEMRGVMNRGRQAVVCVAAVLLAGAVFATPGEPLPQPPQKASDVDRMAWWRAARFGMFIHWGVYSVPAGEWGGRTCDGPSEWLMESLHVPVSQYKSFGATFNPAKYDPGAWARLAKEAGCGYVVITSRHHDGFCLWDSKVSEWDVAATPWKKDLLGPLADACRKEGLKFGLYYSILDWRYPDYTPRRAWNDEPPPADGAKFDRFVAYVHAQVEEVVRAYQPDILWFDGEWEPTWTHARGEALEALVRSIKPDIIMNNRVGKARDGMGGLDRPDMKRLGDFGTPEQEVPARGLPGVDWETCMTMNDSWGFKKSDRQWKSSEQLIRTLCDVASKGGNFLLNVGPTAEGEIPPESVERLRAIGAWMSVNGEAIRGTGPIPGWRTRWGRCTVKSGRMYLEVFAWPSDGWLLLRGLRTSGRATLLGDPTGAALEMADWELGTGLKLPAVPPLGCGPVPVIELVPSEPPDIFEVPLAPGPDGVLVLGAEDAEIRGEHARVEQRGGRSNIGFWTSDKDTIAWQAQMFTAGEFDVDLEFACEAESAGTEFVFESGGASLHGNVRSTGGWDRFDRLALGRIRIGQPGMIGFTVSPVGEVKHAVMNLRQIRLTPVK